MRNETQARDIFDLYHLSNYIDPQKLLPQTFSYIDEAKKNALSIGFDDFKSQVVAYLLPEYQILYQKQNMWDEIVLNVLHLLDELCD